MKTYLLHKATIVTAQKEAVGSVIVSGGKIADVIFAEDEGFDYKLELATSRYEDIETISLEGKHLMAGGVYDKKALGKMSIVYDAFCRGQYDLIFLLERGFSILQKLRGR